MKFTEFNLHEDLLKGVQEAGYVDAMPVQEAVFTHSFAGDDIYAQSQTGSGKTAAFLVTIFQRMMTETSERMRKSLILAPTRELAVQIEEEAKKLAKYLPIEIGSFYGGVGYGPQLDMLRNDVKLIIGTPGRIIDLVKQGKMVLKDVGFLVIDEADRMFDMGFIDDLRLLIRYLPEPNARQTQLFSATLNVRVKNLAWDYMIDPAEIVIESETVTVDTITQELYHVGNDEKMRVLLGIIARDNPDSAIIFCNLKRTVEEVAKRLKINGYDCEYIMGDLPQSSRQRILDNFKEGRLRFLVATDVAARGLDIDSLSMVFNYDLPLEAENYVHRIGRTARAGKSGKAVSLACEKYVYGLYAIEKYLENKVPVMGIDESLLATDKSEGMRFYREHRDIPNHGPRSDRDKARQANRKPAPHSPRSYANDEPRQSSERPRPQGPREGQRQDPNRGPRPQGQGQRQDQGKGQRQNQGQSSNRPQVQGQNRGGQPSRNPGQGQARTGGQDAYAIPQDERMKMYKEKYGGSQGDGKPRHQSPKKAPHEPQKRAHDNDGKRKDADRKPQDQAYRGKRPSPKAPAQQTQTASRTPGKPKQGLIGTIIGLFTKKKGKE